MSQKVARLDQAHSGAVVAPSIAWGSSALDGSNPTRIATGLGHVHAFVATLRSSVAPGLLTQHLTVVPVSGVPGSYDVYAWRVTSAVDATMIASTGTDTFDWIAIGS
jgi:hypothetical protein